MDISDAVVKLPKVVVAAWNDTGSHKLSKCRTTEPHGSLGTNMRLENPYNWWRRYLQSSVLVWLISSGKRGGELIIGRYFLSKLQDCEKMAVQLNVPFCVSVKAYPEHTQWDGRQLTIHCRVVITTAYWLMAEFRIVLLAHPVKIPEIQACCTPRDNAQLGWLIAVN